MMANEQSEKKSTPAKSVPAKKGKPAEGNKVVRALTSIPKRMWRAVQNTWAELKKVTWPGRKDLINYTTIVLAFMALMAIVVGSLDIVATAVIRLIIGA